jgi:hypothetical protein
MAKILTIEAVNDQLSMIQFVIEGEYKGERKPSDFKCLRCGTIENAVFANMRKRKPGRCCTTCDTGFRNRIKSADMEKGRIVITQLEKERGIKCLNFDTAYKGTWSKLEWSCNLCNKIWEALVSNVRFKNSGCPSCSQSQSEDVCRVVLDTMYSPHKFISVRPAFLLYENGRNLEIDCYNEALKLAVEFNGIQHYHYVPHMHNNDEKNFETQKLRDAFKKERLDVENIKFVVVPYLVMRKGISHVKKFIYDNTFEHVKSTVPNVSVDTEYLESNEIDITEARKERLEFQINRFTEVITSDGYRYLNKPANLGLREEIFIVCPQRHHFPTSIDNYLHRGRRCPYCCHSKKRYTVDYIEELVKHNNFPINIVTCDTTGTYRQDCTITYSCDKCKGPRIANFDEFDKMMEKGCFCPCSTTEYVPGRSKAKPKKRNVRSNEEIEASLEKNKHN